MIIRRHLNAVREVDRLAFKVTKHFMVARKDERYFAFPRSLNLHTASVIA